MSFFDFCLCGCGKKILVCLASGSFFHLSAHSLCTNGFILFLTHDCETGNMGSTMVLTGLPRIFFTKHKTKQRLSALHILLISVVTRVAS
jgi:hypothetical protein